MKLTGYEVVAIKAVRFGVGRKRREGNFFFFCFFGFLIPIESRVFFCCVMM